MAKLAFSIPMVWRGPKDRWSDCYYCLVNTQLYISRKINVKWSIPVFHWLRAHCFLCMWDSRPREKH